MVWEARPGFRDFGHLASAAGVIVSGNTSGKGGTFAFDAGTGKLLWASRGRHVKGEPFVDGESAWVISTAGGFAARLTSHALKTGAVRWTVEEENLGIQHGGPVAGDGRVFVISQNGKVKAFDTTSGKVAWEHAYSTSRAECPSALSLSEGVLYFGGGESDNKPGKGRFLWALDAVTGQELWRFVAKPESYTSGECVQAPAVAAGIVVAIARHTVFALEAKTGKLLWSRKADAIVNGRNTILNLSEPLIAQGTVYATNDVALHGWNLRTGTPEFVLAGRFSVDAGVDRKAAAGGVLYFAAELGPARQGETAEPRWPLYALDLKTQQILWKHRTNRPSPYASVAQWRTRSFLRLDGAVVYENESILVKLQ